MLLGAHVSTAGGMSNAVRAGLDLGCEAIQVFTANQRRWLPKPLGDDDVAAFREQAEKAGFLKTAVSHASYLINLCAQSPETLQKSRRALVDEITRCHALSIPYLCLHPGSHVGAGEEAGLALVAESLREALAATTGVTVLLENTAGQGTNLGHRLEHLVELLAVSERLGVCIDTCHLFAAGYDLKGHFDETMAALDPLADRIRAFHFNDSKHACGSRRDRHEHIGEGEIGAEAFRRLMADPRFRDVPALLETPGGPDGYRDNLDRLRKMRDR